MSQFLRKLLSVTFLTLSISAFGAAAQPTVIRIAAPDQGAGSLPFPGGSPIAIVYTNKLLEEEFKRDGIEVQWTLFKGAGPAINEAFANRQIDFAYLGDLAAVIGRAGGLPTHLIAGANRGTNTYLAVPPGSTIKHFSDLKDKRIAVFRGTADQLAFDRALNEHGLTERDLRVINLDWSSARAALAAGQIDGTWSGSGLIALRTRGIAEIALSTRGGSLDATVQAGLVGADAFTAAYPEITTRLVKVFVKAAEWASQENNRQAFIDLLHKQSNIPADVFAGEYGDSDLKFRLSPRIDDFLVGRLSASVAEAKNDKLIRDSFDVNAWVDRRYVDQAVAQLGLQQFWPTFDAAGHAVR